MDILYNFHPFVFGGYSDKGLYSASLPLKTPPPDLLATHGRLFGIFTLRYPDIFPLDILAKEILPYLERQYYENECDSPHGHLIRAVAETQTYLEKRILEVNGVDSVDFSFIGGCVWGSVLYVVRCGGTCALRLYRDTSFGVLFDVNSSSGSSAVTSISGYIQPNDVIVAYDSSIDVTAFPLSTTVLRQIDKQVIYTKISQMFDPGTDTNKVGSISGFYIGADMVPAPDDEQLLLADIQEEKDLSQFTENYDLNYDSEKIDSASVLEAPSPEAPPEDSEVGEHHPTVAEQVVHNQMLRTPFGSGFFSRFTFNHQHLFRFLKKVLAFFSKGRIFILGCMFLLLFLGFIIAGKDYEKTFKVEKQVSALKAELLPKIEEAYKQGQYYTELNPERAKKYLQDAQGFLGQFDSEGQKDPDVAKKITMIAEAYAIVTKTYVLKDLSPFFDLTTVNQSARGVKMALVGSSLVVSDAQQSAVYKVGIDNRSAAPIIGQEDVSGLISAEGEGGIVYAVSARGIVRSQENDSRVLNVREVGSEWGTIVDMQVFGSSVYLLDSGRNQIWKYVPEGSGFGSVRNYISSENEVTLSNAVSLAIDGNVWVGLANGEVVKFFSGKKDVFSLGALDQPLSSLRAVYVEEGSDFLYSLEESTGRVVVFSKKDGSYVSTYQSDQFKGAQDIVADSKSGNLFVLKDTFLYRVELREKSVGSAQ